MQTLSLLRTGLLCCALILSAGLPSTAGAWVAYHGDHYHGAYYHGYHGYYGAPYHRYYNNGFIYGVPVWVGYPRYTAGPMS